MTKRTAKNKNMNKKTHTTRKIVKKCRGEGELRRRKIEG